jgi:pantoate--beta-alanine ligase
VTIFEDPYLLQQQALAWRQAGDEVGLVPTMGALHAGHDSLVARARRENGRVIVSVFVNPMQFGPGEDFASYPRPFERDAERLKALNVDAILHPSVDQLFPSSFKSAVDPGPLGELLEGKARPGHFRGVLTVVLKLLELAQPKRAYFGQKDIQQLLLVRQLARDFAIPVRIVGCPTVREPDGLALSSRNAYLTAEQRQGAPVIFRALRVADRAFRAGQTDPQHLEQAARDEIATLPGLEVDYVACFDEITIQRPAQATAGNILATAVKLGSTRLIDNVVLGAESD